MIDTTDGPVRQEHPDAAEPDSLVGFSSRVNDPIFDTWRRKQFQQGLTLSVILAFLAGACTAVWLSASGMLRLPDSLWAGTGLGVFILSLMASQAFRKKQDESWDGTVTMKASRKRLRLGSSESLVHRHYTEYTFTITRDGGRTYTHRAIDRPGLFDYYAEGDRVRHHKGFAYYEKFDKSADAGILCPVCLTMTAIAEETCRRCGSPLLKP